ncbi:DUF3488 and transglutaminase-like domain-containing protein [Streptomyces sp. RB6PN25]|uniref:DUF3488 and transglutaminase-like domain-containing protein n=1 Tax=Streptomyces humicola TaxID=2953240 RepID=A0ABT1PYE3_9ACTN|nr:DUF3488 and transglutaminase-like domain-containing protein [Streptomyces humicola]MCQ4081530.1 DUF3488 and transglutaminase-like domain-containing protein [Streptomyces humicola]
MSGRGRLTVCAAAATLLTACALLPLTAGAAWLFQAALLVVVASGVGTVARRVPLARAVTVAAQAAVSVVLLTLTFVPGQALLGLVPGPRAIAAFGQLLGHGVQDVGQYAIPAPVTPGIRLLLVGGVVVIGLAVDALAVTYRSAAPAGLPLLALYSVASGLGQAGGHWLLFLCAAGGYLLLLLAEGRDRLSRWGRVFGRAPLPSGYATASPAAVSAAVAPVRTGRRIGAVVLGIALVAPALLPAMDGGLLVRARDGGLGGGGTITAINPLVSLQNSLNQPDDREVLRYRTSSDDAQDMYLRIITLDTFDGTSWKAAQRHVTDVPGTLPPPAGLNSAVQADPVDTSFSAAQGYAQNYLPMPYPASRVQVSGDWRFEPEGRTLVGDRGQTTSGLQYEVTSLQVQPTAQQLADAGPAPAAIEQQYTQVPDTLPAIVKDTAEQVTSGATNAYEQAVKLQDWFTTAGGFTYDTRVAEGSGTDAIVRFLRDKRGFCVHFAFTMAAMARTLGIPARVDVGFVPGTEQPDGSWTVGLKDAHAWPELYFQGVGWTRFEPTPSRGTAPGYTRVDSTSPGPGGAAAPHGGSTALPTPGASASSRCAAGPHHVTGCDNQSQITTGGPGGGAGLGDGTLPVLVAAAVVLVAGAVPMLWRARVRAVRLAAGGGKRWKAGKGDEAGEHAGRTLAAWRELLDTAWDYGVRPDASETPRAAAGRLIREAGLSGAGAESVQRVAVAVEQVLYAPRPGSAEGLADDVRQVRGALRASAGLRVGARAVLAPRSTVQVVRQVSQRCAAQSRTWRVMLGRVLARHA